MRPFSEVVAMSQDASLKKTWRTAAQSLQRGIPSMAMAETVVRDFAPERSAFWRSKGVASHLQDLSKAPCRHAGEWYRQHACFRIVSSASIKGAPLCDGRPIDAKPVSFLTLDNLLRPWWAEIRDEPTKR